MKKNFYLIISLVAIFFLFAACSKSSVSLKRMQQLEEGVSNPNTIDELKDAIAKYERRAMDLVTTEAQEGIWYKMLGVRYLEKQMYVRAYDSFSKAITFYPDNANLYFNKAACAGFIANSQVEKKIDDLPKDDSVDYLKTSEAAYLRALAINERYYQAMYGLGVLYVFQMKEYEKAIPYLKTFLETQTKNTDGMFALACAYYLTGSYAEAISLYDKIIELKPNEQKVKDAEKNKKLALDAQYSNR